MNRDFDDLDRALLALPLEEPPEGLRTSILAATVFAPPVPALAMRTWEIVMIGTMLAVGTFLAILLVQSSSLATQIATGLGSVLSNPAILAWLATGTLVALVVSLLNSPPRFLPRFLTVRSGRS
jgi:hypothetical protein